MNLRALVLIALVSGCSLPHDRASLAGTYVMHMTMNADTLVLRADGRWTRRFHDDTTVFVDSGGWFLSRNNTVALRDYPKRWRFIHDCMYTGNVCPALTQKSMLALPVERTYRGLRSYRLGWHSEWNWWYEPVK